MKRIIIPFVAACSFLVSCSMDEIPQASVDKETVFNSIRKTHRAIVVEEGNLTCGIASEFSATIQEELFDELDAEMENESC